MKASLRTVTTVESHTEGMPTRVVTSGVGEIPGDTMFARRQYFMDHMDEIRQWLMFEPRGHSAMSGAILQQPTRKDADWGVVYIEVSGCLPMCGHGTIGVATVLVEKGLVDVVEPITTIRLDTPAGLVVVEVLVRDGKACNVTLTNVPSFAYQLDQSVEVLGIGNVVYDMAFGGNFYAILPLESIGISFERSQGQAILAAGLAISAAINRQNLPIHPENSEISGCHHIDFIAPGENGPLHWRNAMAIYPGWFDRSPCGTGTSARLAQMVARGQFSEGDVLINESWIGSQFEGRIAGRTTVGDLPAIIPTITGRAWIMGESVWTLDPTDPFPNGFVV
ncbi:MAG: proline racemase family protein [Actinobacteria bacterium]|nr:proline racemase family protein [Actinomycetota bacterium]